MMKLKIFEYSLSQVCKSQQILNIITNDSGSRSIEIHTMLDVTEI